MAKLSQRSAKRGASYVGTMAAVAGVVGLGLLALNAMSLSTTLTSGREAACIASGFEGCAAGSAGGDLGISHTGMLDGDGNPAAGPAAGAVAMPTGEGTTPNPVDYANVDAESLQQVYALQLPTTGDYPFIPPRNFTGKPARGGGYTDKYGNVWEKPKSSAQHGGPHWDVQHRDGSHTNVGENGNVTHGEDNMPQAPSGVDPITGAEIAAGGVGVAGAIWWAAKLLSPVCGPAMPLCAAAL